MSKRNYLSMLNESFGSYRAEWLKNKIFDLFTEPVYFTALQDNRPCVLEGGRGTGKTTVLKSLSYQGQYAIHKNNVTKFNQSKFIGIYHRVDTNHVRAFAGEGIQQETWNKIFSHYFNLLICREMLQFAKWHNIISPEDEILGAHACNLICLSLRLPANCKNFEQILETLDVEMYAFQSKVNNILDTDLPQLSMSGDPIKITSEKLLELQQYKGKTFYIMLDEYENYMDYQQQIINSLIKHSTEHFTFKIGVRELGWRIKHTLNPLELLHDPADYVLINIEHRLTDGDSQFTDFAKEVCQQRLSQILSIEGEQPFQIDEALIGFTNEEEADELNVKETEYYKFIDSVNQSHKGILQGLPNLYLYFISYWARHHDMSLEDAIDNYHRNKTEWDTRYGNYKYELLFKIRRGRGKSGIQKYYSGWTTFTKLANGNIRYLMELVYKTFERHFSEERKNYGKVSPKTQTLAAQDVGYKNLVELEGLSANGAQITKLLLGLGRVFQLLAVSEVKSAPEINQFSIENSESATNDTSNLITSAVMNLALVRSPGNKLNITSQTRDYLYMIHPIYSPFFGYSHRKKRKMILSKDQLAGLINNPQTTIKSILGKSKLDVDDSTPLPSQLDLFNSFYNKN